MKRKSIQFIILFLGGVIVLWQEWSVHQMGLDRTEGYFIPPETIQETTSSAFSGTILLLIIIGSIVFFAGEVLYRMIVKMSSPNSV